VQVLISMENQLTSSQKAPLHKILSGALTSSAPPDVAAVLQQAVHVLQPVWPDDVQKRVDSIFAALYMCVPPARVEVY
jgi:hypothetical protein